jgi:hypothetical protein
MHSRQQEICSLIKEIAAVTFIRDIYIYVCVCVCLYVRVVQRRACFFVEGPIEK